MIPKSLLTAIKFQIFQVIILTVLLLVGLVHLLNKDSSDQTLFSELTERNYSLTQLNVLAQNYVGLNMPEIIVHEALTHKQGMANIDPDGMVIFIPPNTCIQQLTNSLKQAQRIYHTLNKQIPMRVILVNNIYDDEKNRHTALILRKAIRPKFDLWYTNEITPFTQDILETQTGVVVLIQKRKISSLVNMEKATEFLKIFDEVIAKTDHYQSTIDLY
ncbi:MAG: hypothetical protein OXE59_12560 [Bacteroidetes bacterium]|nr:hypothetical protein [Bacteroidota bacterium]MCY4234555.1 hypothetical protein [Bacteroidota bacterium]